ncbi:MAG: xanthine dehydrogenase family protein molybdopterin-binding subunit [Betaproteobacteria bacterium]|nr:xanthine dehydrogenase family protein molybdopterin-binding subunit [Betaproteobacteria bacterium]
MNGGKQQANPGLPGSLETNRRLDRWLKIGRDGTVTIYPGKVEIGQGILTALAQIAAEELDVALERVQVAVASTSHSPDEGTTSGSRSIEESGVALRFAAAEAREILLARAAERLGTTIEQLAVADGVITARSGGSIAYWELAGEDLIAREATAGVKPKSPAEHRIVGQTAKRRDIPAKVAGAPAYVQDLALPGMRYGRVVRPPSYQARLASFDERETRALPGVVAVVRDGSFLGAVAAREEQAIRAARALWRSASWNEASTKLPASGIHAFLLNAPAQDTVISEKVDAKARSRAARSLEATYTRPFIAHASIGPSCAVAQLVDGRYTVWTHSQGIFPLRRDLAKALGVAEERITVIHAEGAGCYGHNGADDAALDAALLARAAPGRPVQVQWMREDEFAWEPYGSAMVVKLGAALDGAGSIVNWRHDVWSHPHSARPGRSGGANLLAGWHLARPLNAAPPRDVPQPAGGSDRNAIPLYDFPNQRVAKHVVTEMPLRVSSLRSLGAHANVFAIESFMDELAAASGVDPLEFRLRHLKDPRARAVIDAAAQAAGWQAGQRGDGVRGRGVGFARYKNLGCYVAVVAEVAVEHEVRVTRAWAAVDAGLVINPGGLVNQIEGGILQAISWTLKEEVRFDRERVTTRSWDDYPILTFAEAPPVEVVLINRPDETAKGAGEGAQGPTAAAIGNALCHALGTRVRDLPITRERVIGAL